jgi:transposase-like protein
MRGHGSKLGRRKEAAIAALLSTRTIEEAARQAGISSRTLLRWLKDPEFREEWLSARRQSLSQATARLQNAAGAAASLLTKALVDPSISPARLKAAQCVLEMAYKGLDSEDFDIRLTKLERTESGDNRNGKELKNSRR